MAAGGLHLSSPRELSERLDAERGGSPFLLLRDGDDRQRIVPLDGTRPSLTVGRQDSSDVALSWDPEVSRAHAGLERIGDVWTVVDDGRSRNGSFVNGERVHGRQALHDGDVLTFGGTRLTFVAPGEHADGSTAVAVRRAAPALSPAQRRVLVALCRPFASARFATPPSNRELAAELCLSVETVKFHLHALFATFGLEEVPQRQQRAQLAQCALEEGVIRVSDLREGGREPPDSRL
jgi:pSer/pThr/pTyr-binding forkhead associated (FHA) protein